MVLDREDRQSAMTKAFQRAVIQVDVSRLQIAGQLVQPHGEAMVLRGDLHFVGALIEDGLIGAAMTELQFESLTSERQAQELMPQADAEERRWIFARQIGNGLNGVP